MKKHVTPVTRRKMLRQLGFGSMAFFAGLNLPFDKTYAAPGNTYLNPGFMNKKEEATVSLVKGNDLRDITFEALKNIEDQIMTSLERKKSILIKPNFVSTNVPLCATSVDSVRGILDFLRPRWKGPIYIGESTASRKGTYDGFINYGYIPLEKEYKVELEDLNEGAYDVRYFLGPENTPQPVRIISRFLNKDQYLISAAKLKTHDLVLVTLSLKNILLAAPYNDYKQNDKPFMHLIKSDRSKNIILHYNMFSLAKEIYPDLGVIDGFEAMEGNGPVGGTPVDARIAMASLDPLALDTIATKIMGFNPAEILYLSSMNKAGMGQGDPDKIKIIGNKLQNIQYHFKPHSSMVEPYGLA